MEQTQLKISHSYLTLLKTLPCWIFQNKFPCPVGFFSTRHTVDNLLLFCLRLIKTVFKSGIERPKLPFMSSARLHTKCSSYSKVGTTTQNWFKLLPLCLLYCLSRCSLTRCLIRISTSLIFCFYYLLLYPGSILI